MPSHLPADHSAAPAAERGTLDSLISQARRLRGGVDAVLQVTGEEGGDARLRWQRALCTLAVNHLDDVGRQLDQLRDGPPSERPGHACSAPAAATETPERATAATRAGSAEWNLLTDEVQWSDELYAIFDRAPQDGPLSLDELPAWVLPEDQPWMMEAVTDCLVDGKPVDGEFRIVRRDGSRRTLHVAGEPVLDREGGTVCMWAVLRDVSELRENERTARESHESLRTEQQVAHVEHRLAVELQEAVLPPWRGSLRLPPGNAPRGAALDLAAHYLPSPTSALIGGDWYDALELPDGSTLLTVGDLTGHGVEATTGMAMLLGAMRGMALAGLGPGPLMGHLNQLLDAAAQPALGSALCCRYDPRTGELSWAQAGHPAPLVFREGRGRTLVPPEGVLLGATSGAVYGEHREHLAPGDLLVLHTDGPAPRSSLLPDGEDSTGSARLLSLAPRLAAARSARECVRVVVEEFSRAEREDDACALVARVCA